MNYNFSALVWQLWICGREPGPAGLLLQWHGSYWELSEEADRCGLVTGGSTLWTSYPAWGKAVSHTLTSLCYRHWRRRSCTIVSTVQFNTNLVFNSVVFVFLISSISRPSIWISKRSTRKNNMGNNWAKKGRNSKMVPSYRADRPEAWLAPQFERKIKLKEKFWKFFPHNDEVITKPCNLVSHRLFSTQVDNNVLFYSSDGIKESLAFFFLCLWCILALLQTTHTNTCSKHTERATRRPDDEVMSFSLVQSYRYL